MVFYLYREKFFLFLTGFLLLKKRKWERPSLLAHQPRQPLQKKIFLNWNEIFFIFRRAFVPYRRFGVDYLFPNYTGYFSLWLSGYCLLPALSRMTEKWRNFFFLRGQPTPLLCVSFFLLDCGPPTRLLIVVKNIKIEVRFFNFWLDQIEKIFKNLVVYDRDARPPTELRV